MVNKAAIVIAIVAVTATAMLVGGLIGHFVTKGEYEDKLEDATKQSGQNSNVNQPQPEKDRENREFLLNTASASEIKETLRYLSKEPHLAGSNRNNDLGDWMIERWKSYGFKTKKEIYNVLLSYPGDKDNRNKAQILSSNGEVEFQCQEVESSLVPEMDTTEAVPPFNGYAKAGTVERSKVYYVNYCRVEDFDYLVSNKGENLTDSIVVCRYGKIFRGNKVRLAQDHGAVGVILFNDPKDNVYGVLPMPNETFPNSWFLPPTGVERGGTSSQKGDPLTMGFPAKGSVINAQSNQAVGVILFNDPEDNVDLTRYNATPADTFPNSWFLPPTGTERGSVMDFSGDPLTPGFPSKDYATRKTVDQVREEKIIPNIPTQPMGYDDAKKFLQALAGEEVQDSWRGKLDVTYKYGGTLANGKKIKIINNNSDERKDISNVFGIIEGAVEPDRYVLIGNHRDAWMFGATDASSGTSVMMETSRMFYELMKQGWRPRRTIIFCSWDGEEYGIIGSIEWLDDVRMLVGERAVAYLNCDSGVVYNQVLKMGASPLLYNLIYETAKLVPHPNRTGLSLYDDWLEGAKNEETNLPTISDLGSGSDHTGFYHRHGIASMDLVYYYDKKKIPITAYYPLYHTTYDTFLNVERFVDPTFDFHKALSQYFSEMLRSLSDSVTIPFVTNDYAKRLQQVYSAFDKKTRDRLQRKGLAGSLDHLKQAIDSFEQAAKDFDERVKKVDTSSWADVRRINDQLFLLERSFLFPLGILDRVYIKHVVFAPSVFDSYASAAFPGVVDALWGIEDNDENAWEKVKYELTKAVYTMESAAKALRPDLI